MAGDDDGDEDEADEEDEEAEGAVDVDGGALGLTGKEM